MKVLLALRDLRRAANRLLNAGGDSWKSQVERENQYQNSLHFWEAFMTTMVTLGSRRGITLLKRFGFSRIWSLVPT